MNKLFSNRSLILGLTLATSLAILLISVRHIILVADLLLINLLSFLLFWLFLAFLLDRFAVAQILGLMGILVVVVLADHYMDFQRNPVTIPLLVLFWLGVARLILPTFFAKYKYGIWVVYGSALVCFLIFRVLPNYFEYYHDYFLASLLLPIPVFVGLWFYEQWRWVKALETDKTQAELSLLKSQINPHFFFNTLNNLYGLAVEKSDRAPSMILKLSDMMRYTIYDGRADFVPLTDELSYLEDYIELQKIRYRQQADIRVRKDLGQPHQIAPLLLIIPLENAFKHGVESLASHAFIRLEITTTAEGISFRIENNYAAKQGKVSGIGLENLRQRLALIYPGRHELLVEQTADTYTLSLEIAME